MNWRLGWTCVCERNKVSERDERRAGQELTTFIPWICRYSIQFTTVVDELVCIPCNAALWDNYETRVGLCQWLRI